MKKSGKLFAILLISAVGLNGCCVFKKGSWAPLPSCKNAEKAAKQDQKNVQPSDDNSAIENKEN